MRNKTHQTFYKKTSFPNLGKMFFYVYLSILTTLQNVPFFNLRCETNKNIKIIKTRTYKCTYEHLLIYLQR